MQWNPNLETGIAKIDQQHQELFRQTDILTDTSKADRIPETLKFLGDYVVKHFTDEQVMHVASHYPKAAAHKQFHQAFVTEFKKLKQEFDSSGKNFAIVLRINHTVLQWLREHIMVHDKEFAKFYRETHP
jgi:hemerythrin